MALTIESYAEYMFRLPPRQHDPITTKTGGSMTPSGAVYHPTKRNPAAPKPTPLIQSTPRPTVMTGGRADPTWDRDLQPKLTAPIPSEGLVTPHGTAKPLGALGTFLSRVDEINAIARTQNYELPSLAAEMRANGFEAISLSSSNADDDMEAANLADLHLNMTPFAPDREELAPLLRRIEWEKYIFGCSPVTKYYLKPKKDGRVTLACTDKRVTPDEIRAQAPRFRKADGEFPTADEVQNARAWADHYKQVVLAQLTPAQFEAYKYKQQPWLDYVDPTAGVEENNLDMILTPEEPSNGGPEEIGLHSVIEGVVTFEPTSAELWPMDIDATVLAAQKNDEFFDDSMDALFDFWMTGSFS